MTPGEPPIDPRYRPNWRTPPNLPHSYDPDVACKMCDASFPLGSDGCHIQTGKVPYKPVSRK